MSTFVPDPFHLLVSGAAAVLTPAAILPWSAVFLTGLGFARGRTWAGHLLVTMVLMVVFTTALARRGVLDPGAQVRVGVPLALAAIAYLWTQEQRHWHRVGALVGLCVGVWAVLFRPEVYGPTLVELRGGWQTPPRWGLLATYHAGTALTLGVAWFAGVGVGRLLPARWSAIVVGVCLVAAAALAVSDGREGLVAWLLLHWPPLPWG